jgi:hypothetical protein
VAATRRRAQNAQETEVPFLRLLRLFAAIKIRRGARRIERIVSHRGLAATKANGRQDKQDLQDRFCLRLKRAMHSFQLNPVNSFILSILSILSKNQASMC